MSSSQPVGRDPYGGRTTSRWGRLATGWLFPSLVLGVRQNSKSKEPGTLDPSEPHLEGSLPNTHLDCDRGGKKLSCLKPLRFGEGSVPAASVNYPAEDVIKIGRDGGHDCCADSMCARSSHWDPALSQR